ncbi:MAG: carbohydrate kinase family protein [Anaerolineales bacterium]|nr:carbohydrate kinase family protein [Anaerolineales bacterium]
MIDYVVYGKIIIDDIRLKNGEIVRNQLGGGGPQGAFGARLWDSSVGILTRSGTDMHPGPKAALEIIGINLEGWVQYEDLPTPHGLMAYDENEYMLGEIDFQARKEAFMRKMGEMLSRELPIPERYQTPKVIHLITEYTKEPMANLALQMKRETGTIYSLEPIIDWHHWSNRDEMIDYFPEVDIVTPDWPSASGIAGSESPLEVVKFWSKLGPDLVAIRHGAKGSYVWDSKLDQIWHVPIAKVDTVDPTGCGNSYGGGLMVAWEKYRDARAAGAAGTVSASYLAKTVGVPPVTAKLESEASLILEKLLDQITLL